MATDTTDLTASLPALRAGRGVHSLDAAAVLRLLPGPRPRVLALGEPTHGEDALLDVRNALFRQLVEEEGYRTIAIESDCLRGRAVDAYVATGAGDLDEVLAEGISHGWGAYAGNRELVRWAREFNARAEDEGRPAAERLRFAGFDGPLEITHADSPRQALTALHTHLAAHLDADLLPCTAATLDALLGPDEPWTNPEAMRDPARSIGRHPEAIQLRLYADELTSLLDAHAPHLAAVSTPEEAETARLYARTAVGLLRYHHAMADTSPARMSRLCGIRDHMMADNLGALAARGPVLVHAQNAHLQREKSSMQMWQGRVEWWSAGALLSARLGDAYAFVATALGTIRHQGVDAPPPDTVEGLLYALRRSPVLLDPARLADALAGAAPAPRVSPWFGYAPLDPGRLSTIDGLVFVRDVERGTEVREGREGRGSGAG
ncbi:erythromycin esterase family protein [Streptomyces sp. Da 82-17]|uniref:erythromycin esterase family protein n=1 Tax=Streptomyces sp. Da 82-17 TaxID=3377116 RepID=UPI0038D43E81